MNCKGRLRLEVAFLIACFSFIPLAARAQHLGGVSAVGSTPVAHAPVRTVRSRPATTSSNHVPRSSNVAIPGNPFGYYGPGNFGPGMGFAPQSSFGPINNLGIEAAIDPATQWRIATAERLFRLHPPAGGVGYYLLTDGGYGYDYEVPQDDSAAQAPADQGSANGPANGQQQPIIIVQQAPGQGYGASSDQESVAPPEPPLPDVGHFTLVLRSGQKIDAIAFTKRNGKIIYVTPDGDRKTISAGDLDDNATKELNEERGTPLQL